MPVVKVLELVGSSPQGFQEAVQNAVSEAARTVENITGVEVVNWTAEVANQQVQEYRANVKVAFVVDNQKRKVKGNV